MGMGVWRLQSVDFNRSTSIGRLTPVGQEICLTGSNATGKMTLTVIRTQSVNRTQSVYE